MLTLGIDTGGTYTDAVLLDSAARHIVAKTKVFTTKHDLTRCIGNCVRSFTGGLLAQVTLVSLSTTLATNAVVEGDTGRVGLMLMGREPEGRLPVAMWRTVGGLLDIKGKVLRHVDEGEVAQVAGEFRGNVDAMAVSGFASVRNPAQELRVRSVIRETLDLPVVCAHELSSSLGHYDRTVTAAINAGLIGRITALVQAVRACMAEADIRAPLMVVRGDGSLIRDDAALMRPIETVLSSPAASIVGGLYLSGSSDALLVDMGGTTTDIAHAHNGRVGINAGGAVVGGWRTMVRAADIATFALGGDSRIALAPEPGKVLVGPRRVRPCCVVTGELALWDAEASRACAMLFAKKMGLELDEFVDRVGATIGNAAEVACLDGALRFDGAKEVAAATLERLVEGSGEGSLVAAEFTLGTDIVAVGAPVEAWIPEVGERLRTQVIIPKHAEVANAVGAAVGQVRVKIDALVRPDWERKTYRAHAPEGVDEFASRYQAEQWALENALRTARERIQEWGGANAEVAEKIEPYHVVDGEGNPVYIETRITVEAIGNPSAIQAV